MEEVGTFWEDERSDIGIEEEETSLKVVGIGKNKVE